VLDDIAYGLMLMLDRHWPDRHRRARRLARDFAEGRPVIVPAWVGPAIDQPTIPGRVRLTPDSAAAEWRPLDSRWHARTLVLGQHRGPATNRDGDHPERPFAHAWDVRDSGGPATVLFLAKPYGAEFADLLTASGHSGR
jgi:hypothetical protein